MTPLRLVPLVLLAGCPWIGAERLDEVWDADGDGVVACAFAERSASCDCDDDDPTVGGGKASIWYEDADGDGIGGGNEAIACAAPAGFLEASGDCDDADPAVGAGTPTTWFLDGDGDTYGDPTRSIVACAPPPGFVANGTDCSDGDPGISPGAPEVCGNGVDDNCNDQIDDADPGPFTATTTCYDDADGDGFAATGAPSVEACSCGPAQASELGDCDDGDSAVHPDTLWYADHDGDGYGGDSFVLSGCDGPASAAPRTGDCNDDLASVFPGAPGEVAWDGIDTNCSGGTDLDVGGDERPDWLELPALGQPFDPASDVQRNACFGPKVSVSGGGAALATAVASATSGTLLQVAFDPTDPAANVYDPVMIDVGELCIVADEGVVIAAEGASNPAVTLGANVQRVILEGLTLQADVGVLSLTISDVLLSRVKGTDFDTFWEGTGGYGTNLTLHHVEVREGNRFGDVYQTLVARHLAIRDVLSAGRAFLTAHASLDIAHLSVDQVATVSGILETTVGPEISLVDLSLTNAIGPLVAASADRDARMTLARVYARDVDSPRTLIGFASKQAGTITVSELDLAVSSSADQAISLDAETITVSDSVVLVDGGSALHATADMGHLSYVAMGSYSPTLSLDGSWTADHMTLAGDDCVEVQGSDLAPTGRLYGACVERPDADLNLNAGAGGELFGDNNATFDLVRFDRCLPPTAWDLRPHPRSVEKNGSWAPGFDHTVDVLVDDTIPYPAHLLFGGYVGGGLVHLLDDLDADGIYDDITAGMPAGETADTWDGDGDGLTTRQEWELGTDPTKADTDGDGNPDSANTTSACL